MKQNRTTASSAIIASSPAFQVYPAEFLADERVARMNNRELGAYFRLICYCWREQSIPREPASLARLCGESTTVMNRMMAIISECFIPDPQNPGRQVHQGLEQERLKQKRYKEEAVRRGTKGAAARWEKTAECLLHKENMPKHENRMVEDGFPIPIPSPIPKNTPKAPKGAVSETPERRQESEELRSKVGAILKRPPGAQWSPAELVALQEIQPVNPGDVSLLTRFYRAPIDRDKDRRRTNLANLLRNWTGELDKARGHFLALEVRNSAI